MKPGVIGIDPGLDGAVAYCMSDGGMDVFDCPVFRPEKGMASINAPRLFDLMRVLQPVHAVIERAQAYPGMGGSSAFNYGTGFGIYLGILAALGVPYTMVMPSVWKRHFHLIKTDKEASRAVATRLVPALSEKLSRKKDHGRAEAALICLYGSAVIVPEHGEAVEARPKMVKMVRRN